MVAQKSIDPMTAQRYQLSPYADVYGYMDDMLLLRRRDTKQSVLLSGADREDLMYIVEMLGPSRFLVGSTERRLGKT